MSSCGSLKWREEQRVLFPFIFISRQQLLTVHPLGSSGWIDHILILIRTIRGSFNTHTFFCYLLREGNAVVIRVTADWGQRPGEQLILYSESGAANQHQL